LIIAKDASKISLEIQNFHLLSVYGQKKAKLGHQSFKSRKYKIYENVAKYLCDRTEKVFKANVCKLVRKVIFSQNNTKSRIL